MKSFLEFVVAIVLVVSLLPHAEILAERLNVTETAYSTAPAGVEVTVANYSQYVVYCEGKANGIGSTLRMGWDLLTNNCRQHDVYDEVILVGKVLSSAVIDGLNKLASQ
jgi:hypothetical protein